MADNQTVEDVRQTQPTTGGVKTPQNDPAAQQVMRDALFALLDAEKENTK